MIGYIFDSFIHGDRLAKRWIKMVIFVENYNPFFVHGTIILSWWLEKLHGVKWHQSLTNKPFSLYFYGKKYLLFFFWFWPLGGGVEKINNLKRIVLFYHTKKVNSQCRNLFDIFKKTMSYAKKSLKYWKDRLIKRNNVWRMEK